MDNEDLKIKKKILLKDFSKGCIYISDSCKQTVDRSNKQILK